MQNACYRGYLCIIGAFIDYTDAIPKCKVEFNKTSFLKDCSNLLFLTHSAVTMAMAMVRMGHAQTHNAKALLCLSFFVFHLM